MTKVILNSGDPRFKLMVQANRQAQISERKICYRMSAATGTDWTRILSDPDLVRHVGKLLQAYREAPVEKREEALLAAMREIKAGGLTSAEVRVRQTRHPAPASSCQLLLPPRPRSNQICSVRTGVATGGVTRESSVS